MALPRRLDDPGTWSLEEGAVLLPLFVGGGGDNLLCGECFFMLAQCVELENLRSQKFICPRCGRESVIPTVVELRALGQDSRAFGAHDRSSDGSRGTEGTPVALPQADRLGSCENSALD